MPVRALIIDYKALVRGDVSKNRALLKWITSHDLAWCLFTTDPVDTDELCDSRGYPHPTTHVQRKDVPGGKARGSGAWVEAAAARLGVQHHELLYVGTTKWDVFSAGHARVFHIHAKWAQEGTGGIKSLIAEAPDEVRLVLETFLLQEPRWAFTHSGDNWELRCLLPASARLPCTSPGRRFTLQDVLSRSENVKIGDTDARSVLMLSALANAYLEGLMTGGALMCVYPSSTPGKVSEHLAGYLQPAASLCHNYYREDLLVRAVKAPDTSLERWRARQQNRTPDVSIVNQATTVHVGAAYHRQKKLAGKTVIVVDDFTTNGMSLDWARMLLTQAGAGRVILVAVGKYVKRGGAQHDVYESRTAISPFKVNNQMTMSDFTKKATPLVDNGNEAILQMSARLEALLAEGEG